MTNSGPRSRSSRIRVVHVVETMELGGMERMIATLALATDRDRFDVHVLCVRNVGPVGAELAQSGIPVHFAALPRASTAWFGFLTLARMLRVLAPDVVHTHNTHALLYGVPGARLAGVQRVIHTEHGRKFPDKRRYMLAEWAISGFVHHVVGVSETMTVALHRYLRIPRRKLRTIPNGVSRFKPSMSTSSGGCTIGLPFPKGRRSWEAFPDWFGRKVSRICCSHGAR